MSPRELPEYIANFQRRVLEDAMAEATSAYWLRRAIAFYAVGTNKCDEIARACQAAAAMANLTEDEVPAMTCLTCGTPTSPWSCSCGLTRVIPREAA